MSDPTRSRPGAEGDRPATVPEHPRRKAALAAVGVLLAAPFVAMLWVTSYNKVEPRLWGFPFFYWYQLMWVVLTSVFTYAAYRLVRATEPPRARLTDRSER